MATTTTTPTTVAPSVETKPVVFTDTAIAKVKEIMAQQNPVPAGLRVGVVGGGCSGFSYSMSFENGAGMMDKTFSFDDLKVFVDATSLMYLKGVTVDYVETLEGAGFKFENPNVKSTCGLRLVLQRLSSLPAATSFGSPVRTDRALLFVPKSLSGATTRLGQGLSTSQGRRVAAVCTPNVESLYNKEFCALFWLDEFLLGRLDEVFA